MSLINEALKRAEADKRGQSYPAPAPPAVKSPAAQAASAKAGSAAAEALKSRLHPDTSPKLAPTAKPSVMGGRPVLWVALAAVVLVGGVVAVRSWKSKTFTVPQQASAVIAQGSGGATADARLAAASMPAARSAQGAGATQPAAAGAALHGRTAGTTSSLRPSAETSSAPSAATSSAPASGPGMTASRFAMPTAVPGSVGLGVFPFAPLRAAAATQPSETVALPASPTVDANPRRPAASAPAREGTYKVSGVMRGSDGWTAIVNGQIVQVGDTVGDGKVVKITARSVTIEENGKKLTVGL